MTRTVTLLLVASAVALAAPVPKGKKAPMPTEVGTKWVYIRGGDEDVTATEEITASAGQLAEAGQRLTSAVGNLKT